MKGLPQKEYQSLLKYDVNRENYVLERKIINKYIILKYLIKKENFVRACLLSLVQWTTKVILGSGKMFGSLRSLGILIWTRNASWEGFEAKVQGWTKELLLKQNPETLIYWQHLKWYGMSKKI